MHDMYMSNRLPYYSPRIFSLRSKKLLDKVLYLLSDRPPSSHSLMFIFDVNGDEFTIEPSEHLVAFTSLDIPH